MKVIRNHIYFPGCFSEDYIYPFRQDLPLLGYMKDHSECVGREWLLSNIDDELLSNSKRVQASRGLVVVADFGYGKSAIVSHLLCAKKEQKGYNIRNHLVAFHVCKFDVPSTKSSERFIRRLVGFFSTKSAEYGSLISMISNDSILYNSDECRKEIEACFDQAITFPFREIKTTSETWLIVIDALDECYSSGENNNAILNLLISRLQKFPVWIKFFITSRHIDQLKFLKKVKIKTLSPQDPNNLQDIRSYIEKMYELKKEKPLKTTTDKLLLKSQGNFLYVLHALQYIVNNNETESDIPEIPETLDDIYELNFDRQFSKGKSFAICKMILEVICTSLNPLTKDVIYKILKDESVLNNSLQRFESEFKKLLFFLNAEESVNIKHEAIHSWLLNKRNIMYRISTKSGHDLISKYLLKSLKYEKTGNVVDLVIHLAESGNKELRNIYDSINITDTLYFDKFSVLHNLIDNSSSADALDLLLQHHNNIDVIGRNNMTPAFLAASKGHLDQLKLLHRNGANMNFSIPGCKCMNIYTTMADVQEAKTKTYTGYTILHIAVQHNFLNIVKFLLDKTYIQLNATNSVGMRASEIACENGYFEILKEIQRRDKNALDKQCLYLATKNGHSGIVKYALSTGFVTGCITDNRAKIEFKKVARECKCDESKLEGRRHLWDVMWLIRQETILHTAIKNGFDDIALMLIESQRELAKCYDAFGYDPLLLAIRYDRINLLSKLLESGHVGNCTGMAKHIENIINSKENYSTEFEQENSCPQGTNFAHLIAINDRTEMIKELLHFPSSEWNTRDVGGYLPVHYAACQSRTIFMFFKDKFGKGIYLEKTSKGTTLYHLAALCNNDPVLREMTQDNSEDLTDLKLHTITDKDQRTILHYLLSFQRQPTVSFEKTGNFISQIAFTYFLQYINLSTTDRFGNNALHYLLPNGHISLLEALFKNFELSNLKHLSLFVNNVQGLSAASLALQSSPLRQLIVSNEFLDALTSNRVSALKPTGLRNVENWEVCLILLVESMTQKELKHFIISSNTPFMILKSPYLTIAAFKEFKLQNRTYLLKNKLRTLIVEGIQFAKNTNIYLNPLYSLFAIASLKADLLHVCGMPLKSSPLHYIILNSLYFDLSTGGNSTVNIILKTINNRARLFCCTAEGYNILHYALIGGNIKLALDLKSRGLPFVTENVSVVDVMLMVNYARFKPGLDQFKEIDKFTANFLAKNKGLVKSEDFCRNKSLNFSLIHILVINGMNKTVKRISRIFGSDILNCVNVDGFSCGYLAGFFNRTKLHRYFIDRGITHNHPTPNAEESLLANLINYFPLTRHKSPYSLLIAKPTPVHMVETRLFIKIYRQFKALFRLYHISFVFSDYFRYNFMYFREGLYLFNRLVVRSQILRRSAMKMIQTESWNCQVYLKLIHSIYTAFQNLKNWSEIRDTFLSWTREYMFLQNITRILNVHGKKKYTFFFENGTFVCPLSDKTSLRHILFSLEKVFKVFIKNLRDIYIFLNLLEQKSFAKLLNYPLKFPEFVTSKFACILHFPVNLYISGRLTTGAVYQVRRFRYLNQVKSTITFKEILSKRNTYGPLLGTSSWNHINENFDLLKNTLHNTKKRKNWLSEHFKCETPRCDCACKNIVTNKQDGAESKPLFKIINVPYF